MKNRYYIIGKNGVNVKRADETGSIHDEFVCEARDWKTAEIIAEALNLKESNRDTDDEEMP